MSTAVQPTTVTIALVGNPNTGKSTLFTALAGVRQRIGNYPGVTVEKKVGHLTHEGKRLALVDLPGTYSLAPRSPDEMIAVDMLLGRLADTPPPDAVLCIVDASNLERNLYLVSQVLELGLPTVIALNMTDVARGRGMAIDLERLRRQLGVPIVETQANRRVGIKELKAALATANERPASKRPSPFPPAFQAEVDALHEAINHHATLPDVPRYLVERLVLDSGGYVERHVLTGSRTALAQPITAARQRLAAEGMPIPAIEAMARYGWVQEVLAGVVKRPDETPKTLSDRIDAVLTHRVSGTLIFLLLMIVVFQAVFAWAGPAMDTIDALFALAGSAAAEVIPPGALQSLVVEGIIAGIGAVIIFLPQILILFFFIAVLEDCGYMARAAYLMDRLMVPAGLSGKSFIPLLSSFACAIPGIMATRVIENRRDRLTTILIAPLMSCSARLPVYVLLIAAFIPNMVLFGPIGLQGVVMASMYLLGIVVAVVVASLLKRTLLRGPTPAFVMEMPDYKFPSPRVVLYRMVDRGWAFLKRAGTLIVAVLIVVWAMLYYPRNPEVVEAPFAERQQQLEAELALLDGNDARREELESEQADLENEIAGAYNRQSYLGRLGHFIEPVVRPLGWDWRIGCAALASFPAREVVVATLGIIFDVGGEVDDEQGQTQLQTALHNATWQGTDRKLFNIPVALSIMVFFALCAQCAATLVVIRRETNSWAWPAFTFVYMTGIAYIAALVTYQVGMMFV